MLADNERHLSKQFCGCFFFPVLLNNKYIIATQAKKKFDLILGKIVIFKKLTLIFAQNALESKINSNLGQRK